MRNTCARLSVTANPPNHGERGAFFYNHGDSVYLSLVLGEASVMYVGISAFPKCVFLSCFSDYFIFKPNHRPLKPSSLIRLARREGIQGGQQGSFQRRTERQRERL